MVNVKKYELDIPVKSTNETGPGVAGIKAISKTLDDLQKKLKPLSDKNKVLVRDLDKLGFAFDKAGKLVSKFDKKIKIDTSKVVEGLNKLRKTPTKELNGLNVALDKTKKRMKAVETISKRLGISMYSAEKMVKQAGVSTKRLGVSYKNADEFQRKAGNSVKRLGGKFKTFGSVMNMDKDAFQGFTKAGYKFTGVMPRAAAGFRVATAGLRGFKMEFLSVMFFGMQMQAIGMGLLGPAMQMFGITDMWTIMLQTVMVPIMEELQPILMWFMNLFIEAPDWVKKAIGVIVLLITAIGFLMFSGAQLGLLFGAIPGKIGIFASVVGKIVGGMHGLFAGFFLKLKVMFLMRGVNANNKKGLGTLVGNTDKTGKKIGKNWKKSMKGMMVGTATGVKGIIAAMGPIGIALAVVAAVIAIFAVAWSGNWYGIRQKTGAFVKWFSGIYDTWIKPVFLHMGTGLIILKNVFFFTLNNLQNNWSIVWLTMQSTAYGIWNGLISGVEWFVNAMLYPFIELSKIGGGLVKNIFGFDMPTLGKINLSGFKIDTKDVDESLRKAGDELKTNLIDMSKDTVKEVEGLSKTLDGLTGFIDESGDAMIESGNQMDAESAKKGKNKSMTDKLKDGIGGLNEGIKNTIPGMDMYNTSIYKNDEAIKTATKGLEGANDVVNNEWAEAMNFQNTKLGDVTKNFDTATEAVKRYTNSLENSSSGSSSRNSSSGSSSRNSSLINSKKALERQIGSIGNRDWRTVAKELGIKTAQYGGIFTKPTFRVIGEAGPEAVIPLNKAGGMGATIHVNNTYNISGVSSKEDIERMIEDSNTKLVDDLKSMLR